MMQVTITQLDAYQPPVLEGASAILPAIVTPGRAVAVTVSAQGLVTSTGTLTSSDVIAGLGYTPYDSANPLGFARLSAVPTDTTELTNGAGFITMAALSGYATQAQLAAAVAPSTVARVATADATPTIVPSLPQPAAGQTVTRGNWRVTAQDTVSGDVAMFDAVAAVKRASAVTPISFVGLPEVTLYAADDSMLACNAAFSIAAGALVLTVTGVEGLNISWIVHELVGF